MRRRQICVYKMLLGFVLVVLRISIHHVLVGLHFTRYPILLSLMYVWVHHSGEPFFTPRLEKAATNLLPHITKGCISDLPSDFLSLYVCTGRSKKYALPVHRSIRGSSKNEAYHCALSQVLGGHRAAPHLASSITAVHNHRRNHRMAGNYLKGLSTCP